MRNYLSLRGQLSELATDLVGRVDRVQIAIILLLLVRRCMLGLFQISGPNFDLLLDFFLLLLLLVFEAGWAVCLRLGRRLRGNVQLDSVALLWGPLIALEVQPLVEIGFAAVCPTVAKVVFVVQRLSLEPAGLFLARSFMLRREGLP